jgi:hypothetical protein
MDNAFNHEGGEEWLRTTALVVAVVDTLRSLWT